MNTNQKLKRVKYPPRNPFYRFYMNVSATMPYILMSANHCLDEPFSLSFFISLFSLSPHSLYLSYYIADVRLHYITDEMTVEREREKNWKKKKL